jgi:hypothetical protein
MEDGERSLEERLLEEGLLEERLLEERLLEERLLEVTGGYAAGYACGILQIYERQNQDVN